MPFQVPCCFFSVEYSYSIIINHITYSICCIFGLLPCLLYSTIYMIHIYIYTHNYVRCHILYMICNLLHMICNLLRTTHNTWSECIGGSEKCITTSNSQQSLGRNLSTCICGYIHTYVCLFVCLSVRASIYLSILAQPCQVYSNLSYPILAFPIPSYPLLPHPICLPICLSRTPKPSEAQTKELKGTRRVHNPKEITST